LAAAVWLGTVTKSRKKTRISRTVVVGDFHAGSTVAPWAPSTILQDGGRYTPNLFQEYLNGCWAVAESEICDLEPDVLVFNGDIIQGGNIRDSQLVTPHTWVQCESAIEQLGEICRVAKKIYFVKGTPWHEGGLSFDVENAAAALGGQINPASGQYTWPELFLDLGKEYVAHFAHSIGISSTPQGEATIPYRDLLNLQQEMQRFYDSSPDVRCIVRSHRHRCIMIQAPPNLAAVVAPGWQLKGEFVYKKQPGSVAQIGYAWLDFDGKRAVPNYRVFDPPALIVEKA
jgi:hypothetical protein